MKRKMSISDIREILEEYVPEEAFEIFGDHNITPGDLAEVGCSINIQVDYTKYIFLHSFEYKQELEELENQEMAYFRSLIKEFHPSIR